MRTPVLFAMMAAAIPMFGGSFSGPSIRYSAAPKGGSRGVSMAAHNAKECDRRRVRNYMARESRKINRRRK